MKTFKQISTGLALSLAILLAGGVINSSAQETMMKSVGNKIESGAKKTYSESKKGVSKARRVGTTVGNKTWNGTRWVAANTYRGGKWVAVKTVNGTKWVYRKGKNTFTRSKKRIL